MSDKIAALDRNDPLAKKRAEFQIPKGVIYLDGNSLGCLPERVTRRMSSTVSAEWGQSLIRGWNQHDWIGLPRRVGARIAPIIGADESDVIACDSTSLNLVKCLSAALKLNADRKIILSDTGNFPTDLYMAQGLAAALEKDHELKLVAPEEIEAALTEDIAVLMLTEVDFCTGRRYDMKALTAAAQARGILTVWDLSHSAGALPVDLKGAHADFAIGCSYKYFNGGPGAPAFIYVRHDHLPHVQPLLSGWMGHEAPFAFDLDYRPAEGMERMTAGTPPILGLSALEAALEVWDDVDMADIRAKSMALGDLFIEEVERRCEGYGLTLASPRNADERGSHVSFHHADGYAIMQALISEGVIGDFRAPDIVRFGFAPLYVSYRDVADAAATLERILKTGLWKNAMFQTRAKVT